MAMWKPISGIQNPIAIREFKGINKLDPFSIGDSYFTSVKNLCSSGYPTMTVRPGFASIGASFGADILGLAAYKDTELHAIGNGAWKVWNGAAWGSALLTGLSISQMWSFCNFQGAFSVINLLGVNGLVAKKYNGSVVSALADCPSGAALIDTHDGCVYVAAETSTASSGVGSVYKSALRDAEDWDTTVTDSTGAVEFVIETPDGADVTGLKAGSEHLVIFKPSYMFELYGTGKNNMKIVPVSDNIGCDAQNTIVNIGGILYFKGKNGIYRYAGGTLPKKDFSLPVQWYMDNINKTYAYRSCAGTDGKNYYLALPIGTATEPSHVLEYDPDYGTWYVWELGHYPRAFTNMGGGWYEGDSSGQVWQLGNGVTADNGTPISWEAVSKPFGAGTLSQQQEWYDLWIVCDLPTGSTLSVYLSPTADGADDWVLTKALTAGSAIQSTRVILPIDTIANANWARIKLVGTGPCTVNEITRQMRVLPYI